MRIYGLLGWTLFSAFAACQSNSNQSGSGEAKTTANVPDQTLLVSTEGKLINFNLDKSIVAWEHVSKKDREGNRSYFSCDEKNVYMPFESGKFIAADIVTGKILWESPRFNTSGGIDAVASSDGSIEDADTISQGPYYMSAPLLWKDKIYIANTSTEPKFLVLNKNDGSLFMSDNIPTRYNSYNPVICRDYVFINSAVCLEMYSDRGTRTSYGMHEDASFESPLYTQMQSDGKTLYMGEENGKFYALPLDEKQQPKGENDIMDPNNTFTKRTEIFKWVFHSPVYSRPAESLASGTALLDDAFVVWVKKEDETQQALIGIDTDKGQQKWIYESKSEITNWNVSNEEITGNNESEVFALDLKGKELFKVSIDTALAPLSNIVKMKNGDYVFSSAKGIVTINQTDKKFMLKVPYNFTPIHHNINYIKYFPN